MRDLIECFTEPNKRKTDLCSLSPSSFFSPMKSFLAATEKYYLAAVCSRGHKQRHLIATSG